MVLFFCSSSIKKIRFRQGYLRGKKMKSSGSNEKLAIGICLGLAIGTIFDNLGIGLALGVFFGAVWSSTEKKDK